MALDFAAGCLGGCAGVLVGHPLDTIKVHLQTQNPKQPMYRGTWHCFKTILARDSVRGLYRGMSSPMGGVAFVNAIVFGVYGNVQRNSADPNSLMSHFVAGSTAGLIQSLVCSPMELAKTRLQLQENFKTTVRHKGPLSCLAHVHRTEGFRGLFRGLGITALRDVPGFSAYFVSYELIMGQISTPTAFHSLLAGGFAGTISWLLTFPMDVIKSCVQADGMTARPQYSGVVDCIRKGYHSEGIGFFCRGLTSTLLRAFPMNAACFFVVSLIMRLANGTQLQLELHPADALVMIASSSVPVSNAHHHAHAIKDIHQKRSHMIKSLMFLGAFSEAVCLSEVEELANEIYPVDNNEYYLCDSQSLPSQCTSASVR